jgi:hypothetical protein
VVHYFRVLVNVVLASGDVGSELARHSSAFQLNFIFQICFSDLLIVFLNAWNGAVVQHAGDGRKAHTELATRLGEVPVTLQEVQSAHELIRQRLFFECDTF